MGVYLKSENFILPLIFPASQTSVQNMLRVEVLVSLTTKTTIFWDVTPFNVEDVYRRFGESTTSAFRIEVC
jgi:hypothetical protein